MKVKRKTDHQTKILFSIFFTATHHKELLNSAGTNKWKLLKTSVFFFYM